MVSDIDYRLLLKKVLFAYAGGCGPRTQPPLLLPGDLDHFTAVEITALKEVVAEMPVTAHAVEQNLAGCSKNFVDSGIATPGANRSST